MITLTILSFILVLCYFIQWLLLSLSCDGDELADIKLDTRYDFLMWMFCPYYLFIRVIINLRAKFNDLPIKTERKKQTRWD